MNKTPVYGKGPGPGAALPCGCIRGYYLCPEAERLWHEVNRAYEEKDWERYESAKRKYEQHFEGVKP